MGVHDSSETDPRTLLAQAVSDPFAGHPATHVQRWFEFLRTNMPLWSFEPYAYVNLQKLGRPTSYPLPRIVESMLLDDGVLVERDGILVAKEDGLEPLQADIDRRRYALFRNSTIVRAADEEVLEGGPPLFLPSMTAELAFSEPESGDYISPHEEAGRELSALLDARDRAEPKSTEVKQAQADLDDFMRSIGARRSKGRPPDAARPLLEGLVREGIRLLTIVRDTLPISVSRGTRVLLESNGVAAKANV